MIKLDGVSWKIETDCRTVGEFMTEAAALFGGHVDIIVDGCRYEFHDTPKIRVTDDTPIGSVVWDYHGGGMFGGASDQFTVLTKPKPKTVRKSGWLNIFRLAGKRVINGLYDSKEQAEKAVGISDEFHVTTVRVEWEEVLK